MNLPSLPQISWIKVGIFVVVVGALAGMIKVYGDARYTAGVSAQQATDLTAAGKILKEYQDGANKLTGQSNDLATFLQKRDDALPAATASILAAIKNKPLTVINPVTGKCDPTPIFGQSWNKLNHVSQ